MSESNASKWQNVSAGPRQIKDLNSAISELRREGATHDELSGVIDGKEHRSTYWSPMSPTRPEVAELDAAICAKYAGQVTRENVRAIIADYEAAMPKARESRPTDDQRITPEQDAERRAKIEAREAAERAEREQRDAVQTAVMAKMPRGARALIIAELHEDTSDPMTDYYGSRTTRTVAIGWRYSAREDFRALRAAAAAFPETAQAAADLTEHRDNHSMGAGNYLSDHGWAGSGSGWLIKSRALPSRYLHITEDAIPATPAGTAPPAEASNGAVTVSPSSLGKPGVIELRFAEKPGPEVLEGLKRGARFRWARGSRCWYGSADAYQRARATWPELPELPANEPETGQAPEGMRADVEGEGYRQLSAEDMRRLTDAADQAPDLFAASA